MKLNFRKVIISSAIFILCNSAQATEPKLLGEHGDWTAYMFMENNSKVCYMVSHPKKTSGNYTKRGDVFALITHRPAESRHQTNLISHSPKGSLEADAQSLN